MFQGTFTAMITPMTRDGQIDSDRLVELVRRQVKSGIDGLVPVGTTGESPTLTHEEHRHVIELTVATVAGLKAKTRVVAGTGSNSTQEALELTKYAAGVGVDAALMVNPYYNKPSQEGLYRHFMTIAEAVDLPIILYNIPGRTGITMSPQTVARLAKHPNIQGIKEATGSLDMASEIATLVDPRKFAILSGDDSLTLPIISVGGSGVVSVLSNLIPKPVKTMVDAALAGNFAKAGKMHRSLFPLFKGMFVETNPVPIKTAMAMIGLDTGTLRLPLCQLTDANRRGLAELLKQQGIGQ